MSAFIDAHRARFGVEPICRTLDVSASAYYQRASGQRSAREIEDERVLARIREVHAANYEAYGYRRLWKALLREGAQVPRCQVQRLMAANGIQGAKRRGKPWRTTTADAEARALPDLLERDFSAEGPNRRWVADFTYVRCWEGVVFFAFILDVYSRMIVGWQFAAHMRTELVEDALEMAVGQRRPGADVALVHHSDRGSQTGLNRSSQQCVVRSRYRLAVTGLAGDHRGWTGVTRLSSRRLARRAGRSGDSPRARRPGPLPRSRFASSVVRVCLRRSG